MPIPKALATLLLLALASHGPSPGFAQPKDSGPAADARDPAWIKAHLNDVDQKVGAEIKDLVGL
jgi:hypothetical protein